MSEIRKLFVSEHFKQIGFVDGMKWIRKDSGEIVKHEDVLNYIERGVLHG